jgi:hypothetical protein
MNICILAHADEPTDGGAQVSVVVAPDGETTLEVKSGAMKVKAGGEETRVKAHQSVRVKKGQRAKKISTLAAPEPVTPADGQHLNTLEVPLEWSRIDGAKSYKLEIAADDKFKSPLPQAPAASEKTKAKVKEGTWWWRVQAVDGDGLVGKPSPPRTFVVDVKPPKLKTGKPTWQ